MSPSEHRLRAEQLRREGRMQLAQQYDNVASMIERRLQRKPTLH